MIAVDGIRSLFSFFFVYPNTSLNANISAKLIDKDIRNSRRGAMTEIVNALFEEYYKSQGRL